MKLNLLLQLVLSILISVAIGFLTFDKLEELNGKNTLQALIKVNDFPNSDQLNELELKNKIQIYLYESKDQILRINNNSECDKLDKHLNPIILLKDEFTQHFQLKITTNKSKSILNACFKDFLSVANKKYNNYVKKLEENNNITIQSPRIAKEFLEKNFGSLLENSITSNNQDQLMLLLFNLKFESLDKINYIQRLKSTPPLEIIRSEIISSKISFKKYILSLFIIIFSITITAFNYKFILKSKILKSLKKII